MLYFIFHLLAEREHGAIAAHGTSSAIAEAKIQPQLEGMTERALLLRLAAKTS